MLSPLQRQSQVQEIFHVLRDASVADRAYLLTKLCGPDEELARAVQALLQAEHPTQEAQPAAAKEPDTSPGPQTHSWSAAPDTATPPGLLPGPATMVAGYQILGELGRGGMGVVYHARHQDLKRYVALKMVLAGSHASAQSLERFRLEAEAVARIQHPHIVQIHDVGLHDGRPFLALEYVDGGTLAARLKGTPLPPAEAAALAETLARAMQAAHDKGIVHRDLKPGNILLTKAGQPKITDFGLAKDLDATETRTSSGALMGTPSYMAPEQAEGRVRAIGPATDVYALGTILYETLTGRPPFTGASGMEVVAQVISREPVSPRQLQPSVPRDLETICLKCLQKEPSRRYLTAEELAWDLHRFRKGLPIKARPVSRFSRTLRWCRRNPAMAGLLAAIVVVLVGGTTTSYLLAREAQARAEEARQQESNAQTQRRAAEEAQRKATEESFRAEEMKQLRQRADDQAGKPPRARPRPRNYGSKRKPNANRRKKMPKRPWPMPGEPRRSGVKPMPVPSRPRSSQMPSAA